MKFRLTVVYILGALMLSEGAFALSCTKPDLIKTLEEAKASDKLYQVLVGKFVSESAVTSDRGVPLEFGIARLDGTGVVRAPEGYKTPKTTGSWFEGFSLAKDKSNDDNLTRFPVDVQTHCTGMWCSSPPASNRTVVAFVEVREGQVPLLKASPCPKWIFTGNIPAYEGNIRYCLDKDCTGLQLRSPDAYTHPRPK